MLLKLPPLKQLPKSDAVSVGRRTGNAVVIDRSDIGGGGAGCKAAHVADIVVDAVDDDDDDENDADADEAKAQRCM